MGQISFDPEQIINGTADNARHCFVIDLDQDGDKDVLSASQNDDRIAWYENDGNQSFTMNNITTSLDLANGVVAGDLDGDGDIDVAASSFTTTTGKIVWFRNDGSQNFTQVNIQTLNKAHGIVIEDIENDGDLDLIVTVRNDDKITLCTNDGLANFTSTDIVTGSANCNSPRTVWIDDVDSDGDKDVLYQAMLGGAIYWLDNDGSQNFTPNTISSTNVGDSKFISSGDLDGDNDTDVITASFGSDRLSWWENDGSQNFTEHLINGTDLNPFCCYPVDVDLDGDLDIMAAHSANNHYGWYENDGSGNFGAKQIISGTSTCTGAIYIQPSDLDGDGDIDAVTAAKDDDDVSWFENKQTSLPINLVWFESHCKDEVTNLEWQTSSEQYNKEFIIEESVNGLDWIEIGKLEGQEFSNAPIDYFYEVASPRNSLVYYRLSQIDFDGSVNIIKTISSDCYVEDQFTAYPNPFLDEITLKGGRIEGVGVYNSFGQLVHSKYSSITNKLEIFAPQGIYFVVVNSGNRTQSITLSKLSR